MQCMVVNIGKTLNSGIGWIELYKLNRKKVFWKYKILKYTLKVGLFEIPNKKYFLKIKQNTKYSNSI
jgi:hypothetical protein